MDKNYHLTGIIFKNSIINLKNVQKQLEKMSTAISCEQFKHQIKSVQNKDKIDELFSERSEYIKNLNQMITTDWIPEFNIN